MDTTKTILEAGFQAIRDYLDSTDCSEDTRKRYHSAFCSVEMFFSATAKKDFDPDVNIQYRIDLDRQLSQGIISVKKHTFLRRVSYMLDDFYHGNAIQMRYSSGKRYKYALNDSALQWVEQFKESLTISPISVPGACSIARDFFYYLQQNRMEHNLQSITVDELTDFLNQEFISHKGSMNNVMCYLRMILAFLNSHGIVVPNPELVSFKTAPARRRVYPAFDAEEMDALLKAPDRTSEMGKRDYAILLLGSFTGVRAIDIANLKFENIDRPGFAISFVQHKTGKLNAVPINGDILMAIDDYVNTVRPDCDLPYVFLAMGKPYRKLHDMASVRNIVYRYIRISGMKKIPWDGKTFHAFRRTIGKWLLESSEDSHMISQVLGQRDHDVLKKYLPLSADSLRECALDFSYAPLTAEVFL